MDAFNACGGCTLCCKLSAVPDLGKPANEWCAYCAKGQGCRVYGTRPQGCRDFRCVWLGTQSSPAGKMPLSMRPDKLKVMFTIGPALHGDAAAAEPVVCVVVDASYPGAWRNPVVLRELDRLREGCPDHKMLLMIGGKTELLEKGQEGR